MAGTDHTLRALDRYRAILFDDFICGRVGKVADPALGAGLGYSRQILERMKSCLSGVTQRMAAIATVERHADQTLDRSAYRPHGVELLVDHVSRHIVALKQVAVEAAKIAIDPFALLYLFNAVHCRSLAFIKKPRLIVSFDLLHLAHQVIA